MVHHESQGIRVECEGLDPEGKPLKGPMEGQTPHLWIQVLTPRLLRIRLSPSGSWLPRRSWAVTQSNWDPIPFQVREDGSLIEMETEALKLQITRDPVGIRVLDSEGHVLDQDAEAGMIWRPGQVGLRKRIKPGEHLYGLGERTGLLEKSGRTYTNWTVDQWQHHSMVDNLYQAIPWLLTLRPGQCCGYFVNTTYRSRFDLGVDRGEPDPGHWQMEAETSELDYYLMVGSTPAQVVQLLGFLTGRMPLPPLWALGYQQCRWSYNSEVKIRQLTTTFRQKQIPCDVVYFDIDYMRGFRVFTWDPVRFGDPRGLIADLASQGFRVVAILDPGVKFDPEAGYAPFDQGLENDYFLRKADGSLFHGYVWPDKSVFPDFARAEVRQWWGQLQESLTSQGIAGIWNDMNEPAISDRPFGDPGSLISPPLDAPQGSAEERTTHAEVHNLYGYLMARASREGLQHLRPQERSFVLTRSGYAGIQAWSAVWGGDNFSAWDHLEMSLAMLCNLGLSGVAFVGADIGGFGGNATPELFARWMQVGVLYPLMRGHSAMGTQAHEPWRFGPEVERICREAIELRYQLLPYLYTLFQNASELGDPILRPMLYEFPQDPATYHLADQVMLGSHLLAAPILRPGITKRVVYLPAGRWYDWWSHQSYLGPTHILADAPLDRLPLYIRSGGVIPLAPVMQFTHERPWDPLHLKIAPGHGEGMLYEDDGHSFDYQTGSWAKTPVQILDLASGYAVEIGSRQGNWTPPPRQIIVEVLGYPPQTISPQTASPHTLRFDQPLEGHT